MKRAFAYVCAPEDAGVRQLKQYCRQIMELGYHPICPRLELRCYLDAGIPEEQQNIQELCEERLRRSRMLVVCGNDVTGTMAAELSVANKLNLISTTLSGLKQCRTKQNPDR